MSKKIKSIKNKAKNIETKSSPKLKRVEIPDMAKIEIARMSQNLDRYLAGVVAGLNIKGKWSFDTQKMQLFIEEK